MRSQLLKICAYLLSTALLAACGGSGTTAGEGETLGENQPSTVVGQPITDSQIQNESVTGSDTNGSVSATDSETQSTDTVTDANDSVSLIADNTYPNSFCIEPGSTSVSFEAYEPLGILSLESNPLFGGVYVPFPASGFGWDGEKVCDLEGSRELDIIEVLVPYAAQRPDTDGNIVPGEWGKAAKAGNYNYETRANDIHNLLLSPVPGYQDGSGTSAWWAMHDGTNLYIRIRISQDRFPEVFSDSEFPWNDDSVELYIDGDNSKAKSYDGINDYQVTLLPDNNVLPVIAEFAPQDLQIFHRAGNNFGIFIIEVAINIESAGIEIGRPFGFDVHINEDDNGGDRDAKWGWFEKSGFDRSWMNPSRLGTLLLTDCEDRNQCGSFQSLTR